MAEKREMTAVEYFQERNRMTKECKILCKDCPLDNGCDNGLTCGILQRKYPEEAVAIVQKWSAEHPQKTIISDFLEKYPNAPMNKRGFPRNVCPYDLGYVEGECTSNGILGDHCKECWDRPLEE